MGDWSILELVLFLMSAVYAVFSVILIGVFIRLMVSKYIEKKAKRIKRINRLEELPHNNVLQPVEVRVDKEIDICSDRYYQATNEECVGINRGS